MTVVWSARAVAHLEALRAWIARDRPRADADVAATLIAAVELLGEHPNVGRPGRVAGTRELVVPGTPFVIPYRVRGEQVEVVAVFHGRQRWPESL